MRIRPFMPIVLGFAMLAACARNGPPHRFGGSGEGTRRTMGGPGGMGPRGGLFVSPAGEPFRAAPRQPAPMAAWFAQADANGDGAIGVAEFQADFRRYFALLDTNHDGEIAPDEVSRYETEILPEMSSRSFGGGIGGGRREGGGMGQGGMGGMGGHRGAARPGGRQGGVGRTMLTTGAARFGLLPISHPIMEADEDFNRGVAVAEWDRAAATRFNALDEAHGGRLTLAELAARRARLFEGMRGQRGRGGRRGPPAAPTAATDQPQ